MFKINIDYAEHLPHLLSLGGILLAGVVGWVAFSYDRSFQMVMALSLPVAYFAWGVVHHFLHEDLYFRVIVEYLVIAVLGAILLTSVIFYT